jgi:hypothetical protein
VLTNPLCAHTTLIALCLHPSLTLISPCKSLSANIDGDGTGWKGAKKLTLKDMKKRGGDTDDDDDYDDEDC